MSDRVNAGARIPEGIHDLHVENVLEKWGREGVYLGTEADNAIHEYLDKDEASSFEERLRERCASVGCSTPKEKTLVDDTGEGAKPRAMWRVHPELKEELKKYAKETGNTYSDVFALAIREYWTNSRLDRLEVLYDRLETVIEPWEDQIGSDGVNASVVDRRTAEIAMEVPDWDEVPRAKIEDAIAEVTSDSKYNREKYTPLVAEYKGFEENPLTEKIFVRHERAEEIRERQDVNGGAPDVFEQSFDDLSAEDRVLRVRARLYRDAQARHGKAAMDHTEISAEFDDDPGKTTVYNMMHSAAEANGFEVASPHGTKRLQVNVRKVNDQDVIEAASEDDTDATETVRSELDALTSAEPVQ